MVDVGQPIRRILVPVDLGRRDSQLRTYAIALAKQLSGELLFFAVIDSPTIPRAPEIEISSVGAAGRFIVEIYSPRDV